MQGQYSDAEFTALCQKAGKLRYSIDYVEKTAWIQYGKHTTNYYIQHSDGSWTNYDCKTKY